mmetsp:Transcript_19645/g.54582  ORF Transcript_19645/g.54582 Transcript_19645/m.54582 type:complete len:124 (-) Transcript_19645:47-418(-)|eukprot:CAMPEP_0117649484 /NCGR_PEP_ID=MMETSP0804-20121206/997_1 /TAXON_ID=1074897 /ORGANISM="Tetraselmis astigmatica, Strain CCMP880" /LENGTH=123 /DNA_ID=CAMNT_0005455225 /DNA_START=321 /DNA_END=692 /DNA_ORIENTATION=+
MQAVCSTSSLKGLSLSRSAVRRSAVKATRPAARIVCKAQAEQKVNKAAAAVATVATTFAAHPAFALVDERLNGDGTGLSLGINDSTLGWVILGVFTLIWTQFYAAQRDVDGGVDTDDDSGLTL